MITPRHEQNRRDKVSQKAALIEQVRATLYSRLEEYPNNVYIEDTEEFTRLEYKDKFAIFQYTAEKISFGRLPPSYSSTQSHKSPLDQMEGMIDERLEWLLG